jgi:hypothetical protein
MLETTYSLEEIHLPENKKLVRFFKNASFALTFLLLFLSVLFFVINPLLPAGQKLLLISLLGFLCICLQLLIEKKIGAVGFMEKGTKWEKRLLPIFFFLLTVVVVIIGIFHLFNPANKGIFIGINLLLVGIGITIPRLKFMHRFHFAQTIIIIALLYSSFTLLNYLYNKLFLLNQGVEFILASLFIFVSWWIACIASLLRWPNRGFMGIFTADTMSSIFALRILIINIFTTPVISLLVLIGTERHILDRYEEIAMLVIILILLSSILAWLNIKLLYRLELENFLMKEELRIHNISLKLGNEELVSKMTSLEKTNKEYANKISYRDKFEDLSERLG